MKKLFATLAAVGSSALAFAEGTGPDVTAIVGGTDSVLDKVQDYIEAVVAGAWPIIAAIVGVGLLIWLGRAMIRAVRSYFTTSM